MGLQHRHIFPYKYQSLHMADSHIPLLSTQGIIMSTHTEKKQKMDEQSSDVSIAIVGGGIGGLGAALSLQLSGFNVTVYERDTAFNDRRQGFGLTLCNNKKGALNYLGILDECIRRDCPSNCHYVFRPNGNICGYYGRNIINRMKSSATSTSNSSDINDTASETIIRGNLRIPRQDLRDMLVSRLKPGTIKWGYKLSGYVEEDDGVTMTFHTTSSATATDSVVRIKATCLIGADGIRSTVRSLLDGKEAIPEMVSPLKYLNVAVILGLTTLTHPSINRRGFYVLDGIHRLFVMPFKEASEKKTDATDDNDYSCKQLTMWQLSFSNMNEADAIKLKTACPEILLQEALSRTAGWMEPVKDMLCNTPLQEVWGTALYDRDTMHVYSKRNIGKGKISKCKSKVTVLGDGCHPQSMFKGFGANQALEDGPLLASWLGRKGLNSQNISTRLRCFEREMVGRVGSKVLASRQAAKKLHSNDIFHEDFGFEGIDDAALLPTIYQKLADATVGAQCFDSIDDKVYEICKDYIHVK